MDKNAVICTMNILLVSATRAEIMPTLEHLDNWHNASVEVCISGVGMMATAYNLGVALNTKPYDLALQCGIGGSFDRSIALGSVLQITSEQMGDLGAEDHENFLDVYDLGLLKENEGPFTNKKLVADAGKYTQQINLPKADGLTINTVSGSEATIERLIKKYNCQVESMEGAAFHFSCLKAGVPFAQIRAISNYVEPRNRANWQMENAIKNLNNWLISFLEDITENNF